MIPYVENFFSNPEADDLFAFCQSLPRARPRNPRNLSTFIRKVSCGCYSPLPSAHSPSMLFGTVHGGKVHSVESAPQQICEFADRLSVYAGKKINYLSILAYENGDDFINWHQRNEDRVLDDQSVWVISLGEELQLLTATTRIELWPEIASLLEPPTAACTCYRAVTTQLMTTQCCQRKECTG